MDLKIKDFAAAQGVSESIIKVNGKTSGLEPGDESEHLIPPFGPKI